MVRPKNPAIREQRQQQILQAARTVFAEHGFAEARMDDVAQSCGLSKGTLYLYYRNKDELVAGLLETTFSELLAQFGALLDINEPTQTRLLNMAHQTAAYMQQDSSALNIAYEYYAVAARNAAVRQSLSAYFADYRRILAALLDQGIQRGDYVAFDSAQGAILLIALLEGMTLLWFTDPVTIDLAVMLPQAVQQFLSVWTRKEQSR